MKKKHFLGFLASLACLTCFAACGGEENAPDLNKAKDMLDGLYKSTAEVTGSDFERVGKLTIDKNDYTIVWTVELAEGVTEGVTVTKNEDGTYTIDVDEEAEADVAYVLKATITDKNGKTKVVTYNHKVPKFVEMTHEEFVAAEDEAAVVVKGVVTGIVNTESKHELYFEDADGGYYAYNLAKEELEGVAIGNTVRVRGTRGTYSGVYQINDGAVEVLDESTTAPEATDITQAFKDAETLKDEDLLAYQSQYVKLTGAIVLGQNKSNDTYFDFMLGGKITYVRISGSACMFGESDQNAFKDAVEANVGKEATVTGLVSIYGGKAYIIPVTKDAYTYNTTATERTAAEKVELEKQILEILFDTYELTDDTKVQTKGIVYPDDVTISWASNNADLVTFDAKSSTLKVTLPKDAAKEITLTATISCEGTDSKTATFEEITVIKDPPLVPDAITAKPVAGQAYKFYLYQAGLKKNLYFAGDMDGYYLATTGNPELAADIYLKDAGEGKFYIYYGNADATKGIYINLYARESSGKWNPSISTGRDATTKWNWSTEYNTFISDPITTTDGVDPITAYLGTYGTYSTFSSSLVSYLGGSTNYAAQLATLINKETAEPQVKADKELKDLDLSGIAKAYTESTTVTLPTQAQYFEGVTISWAVKSGASVASISGSTLTLTPGSSAVDVTLTVTVSVGGKTATKDVTFKVESMVYLTVNTTPVVNTAYTLYVVHADLNKTLYATGAMSGNYLATTEAIGEAAAFYVTDAGEGKFYLNFNNEKYLNVTTYKNKDNKQAPSIALGDTAITKWNWNSEYNTFVSDEVAEITSTTTKTVYIGAYGTHTTMSFSSTYYIGKEGNFNTRLLKAVKTSEITEADKIAQEVAMFAPTFETDFTEDGEITVPVAGTTFTDVAIAWASNNTAVAAVNGNKVTITRGNEAAEVTLTATFSCGTATVQTYTVTLNVAAKVIPELTITEAVTKGLDDTDEAKYYVSGTVVEVYNAKYGNVYIADDAGNEIYVYGTLDSEGNQGQDMADPLQVGDKVKLLSICTQYKGSAQLSNAVVVENTTPTTHSDAVKALIEGHKISTTTTIEENTNVTVPVAGTTFTDVTITWVSNNTTAAAVSGNKIVYTLGEEAQTVTLTATVKSGSFEKAYTFTVAVAAIPKPVEGTVEEFAIAANTGTSGTKSLSWSSEHFNFLAEQANSTTTIRTSDSSHYRAYKGSTFKISSKNGEGIKQIVFTCEPESYGNNYANPMVDSLTTEGLTATVSGQTVTVVVDEGTVTEVLFTATAQFRINKIVITYA